MSAPRGAAGGRGGRGGRVGTAKPSRGGGASAPPLAAQMRQVQRLDEPKEMALFRRYRDLGPTQVKSIYGSTGLLAQVLVVPTTNIKPHWGLTVGRSATQDVSLLEAETARINIDASNARDRAFERRVARLGEAYASRSWDSLSQESKQVLLLSNSEYAKRTQTSVSRSGNGEAGPAAGASSLPPSGDKGKATK